MENNIYGEELLKNDNLDLYSLVNVKTSKYQLQAIKVTKDSLIVLCIFLLTLRDFIFIFNESISPLISICIYGLLFCNFVLEILLFSKLKLIRSFAIALFFILIPLILHPTSYPLLTIFLFVYMLKNKAIKDVIKLFFYPRFIISLIAVFMFELGLTNDVASDISYKLNGGTFHTMGLSSNPNTTAAYFFCTIMLSYIYGKIFHHRIFIILPIIIALYITKLTLSRTVLLSTIALYVLEYIYRNPKMAMLKIALLKIPLLLILFTFVLAILLYDNEIFNELFSFRPTYWHNFISRLNIINIIIGTGMSFGITVDSGYLGLFIFGGVLIYIPFFFLLKKCSRMIPTNYSFFVYILTIFCFSFMEGIAMIQLRDITVLLYLFLWYLRKSKTTNMVKLNRNYRDSFSERN